MAAEQIAAGSRERRRRDSVTERESAGEGRVTAVAAQPPQPLLSDVDVRGLS